MIHINYIIHFILKNNPQIESLNAIYGCTKGVWKLSFVAISSEGEGIEIVYEFGESDMPVPSTVEKEFTLERVERDLINALIAARMEEDIDSISEV